MRRRTDNEFPGGGENPLEVKPHKAAAGGNSPAAAKRDPNEAHKAKIAAAWQDSLWARWPTPEAWPGILDLYEAAAYLRVCYDLVRDACQPARDGTAKLSHQRIGRTYRIRRETLDRYGAVTGRRA